LENHWKVASDQESALSQTFFFVFKRQDKDVGPRLFHKFCEICCRSDIADDVHIRLICDRRHHHIPH